MLFTFSLVSTVCSDAGYFVAAQHKRNFPKNVNIILMEHSFRCLVSLQDIVQKSAVYIAYNNIVQKLHNPENSCMATRTEILEIFPFFTLFTTCKSSLLLSYNFVQFKYMFFLQIKEDRNRKWLGNSTFCSQWKISS